jgi:hypothetical protein
MKRIRAHLSYANIAATLALLFAMSGGAIAATGGFSSGGTLRGCVNEEGGLKLLKAGKHCRRGLKTVAWNSAGRTGATGASGAKGAAGVAGSAGTPGKEGAKGADGTALAYADFAANGTIQTNTVPKGLDASNIDHVEAGIYCFKNLDFATNTAMVSADNSFAANETVVSVVVTPATNLTPCKEGEHVRVRTFKSTTGVLTDEPFNIWFNS